MGCGGGNSTSSSPGATAGSTEAGTGAPRAPACHARDFEVSQSQGAGLGTTYLGLKLRNVTSATCLLDRALRAQLIGPGGGVLLASKRNPSTVRSLTLAPNEVALVTIGWSNWCRRTDGPFRTRVVLPTGGGNLLTKSFGPASCVGPASEPSKLFISGMERPSAHSANTAPASAGAAQHRACASGGGSLVGDVDGDGKADRVAIVGSPAQSNGCVYGLVVRTGSGKRRYGLGTRTYARPPPEAPQLDALARIDRRAGLEIVVDLWQGASTRFAGVFTLSSGRLVMMSGQTAPPDTPEGRGFPYAGSVTHQDGVDCSGGAGSGLIVASGAAGFNGKQWKVTRRFYRAAASGLVELPSRTQRVHVPYRIGNNLSGRFPEFADRPFPSCTEATP
ncbi:MAG: DUF4232 domain-containing protein [Solirubrobacterales bacterium]